MSYTPRPSEFATCIAFSADAIDTPLPKAAPSLLQRFANAVSRWEHRRVDREMAHLLSRSGGQMSDGIEREMMQRLTAGLGGQRG